MMSLHLMGGPGVKKSDFHSFANAQTTPSHGPYYNQTAMDLLKRYATLRRERTAAERELDDLTARHHAVRGEGLVQTLVRCSEDIEVVRVCDARLEDLRRPETLLKVKTGVYIHRLHTSLEPMVDRWFWRLSDRPSSSTANPIPEKDFQNLPEQHKTVARCLKNCLIVNAVIDANKYTSMLEVLEQARKEAADRISAAALTMASDLTGAAARTLQDELEAQKARVQRLTDELAEVEAAVRASLGDDDEALKELFELASVARSSKA